MIIGVVSDTHGSLPPAVCEAFCSVDGGVGVDHIIHAGDIGAQRVLDELELIAPVTAVLGNCDYSEYYVLKDGAVTDVRTREYLELAGRRIFIAHNPREINNAFFSLRPAAAQNPLPHICIHGHTHMPKNEIRNSIRILCPGSPKSPRGNSKATVLILKLPEESALSDATVEFIAVR